MLGLRKKLKKFSEFPKFKKKFGKAREANAPVLFYPPPPTKIFI